MLKEMPATLEAQIEALHRYRSLVTGIGADGEAIRAPFGRFLLIENGLECLALRITKHIDFQEINGERLYTAKYDWFLQTDGSKNFSKPNVQTGSGQVSESNDRTSGAAYIKAGSFPLLEWSLSDWIYFNLGPMPMGGYPPGSDDALREKTMRMAITDWGRIEDVEPESRSLTWLSKDQARGLSRHCTPDSVP